MPPPPATNTITKPPDSTSKDDLSPPTLKLALLSVAGVNVCLFQVSDIHHTSEWLFTTTPTHYGLIAAVTAVAEVLADLPAPQAPVPASRLRRISVNPYTLHKAPVAWVTLSDHLGNHFRNATVDSSPVSTAFYRRIELVANRITAASGAPPRLVMKMLIACFTTRIDRAAILRHDLDKYFTPTPSSRCTHTWVLASILAAGPQEPTPALVAQFLGETDTANGHLFLNKLTRATLHHHRNPSPASLNCVLTLAHTLWLALHGNPSHTVTSIAIIPLACQPCFHSVRLIRPFAIDLPPRQTRKPSLACIFCSRHHHVTECPPIRDLYPHPCPDLSQRAMMAAMTITNAHGHSILGHPTSARTPMICAFSCYQKHEETTRVLGLPPRTCPSLAFGRPNTIRTIYAQLRSPPTAIPLDRSFLPPTQADNDRPNDPNNVALPKKLYDRDDRLPDLSPAPNRANRPEKRSTDKPGLHPSRSDSDLSSGPSTSGSPLPGSPSSGGKRTKSLPGRPHTSALADALQQVASTLRANAAPFTPRAHVQHPGPNKMTQTKALLDAPPLSRTAHRVTFAPSLLASSPSPTDSSPPSLISPSPPSLISPANLAEPPNASPPLTSQGIPAAYDSDPADDVLRQTHGDISMSLSGQPYPETTHQTILGKRPKVAPLFQAGLCVRASVASQSVDFLVDGGQAFNSIAADQITALRHSMPEREFDKHVQLFVQGNKPPPGHPLAHPIFRKRDCALITIRLGAIGRTQLPFFVTGPEWPGGNGIGRNALQSWGAELAPCDSVFPNNSCQCGSTWHLGYTRFGSGLASYRVTPAFSEDTASLFRPWVAPRD